MKQEDFLKHIESTKEFLADELSKIRTGRASTALIEDIKVEAYGGADPLPLRELASISIPEPQTILITPWDKSITGKIETAITKSGKGFNPVNDGEHVRIPIPALNEERRMQIGKEISALVEKAKIRLRTLRQDMIKSVEEQQDNGVITEDDMFREKKQVDEEISLANKEFDSMGELKTQEVMKV